MRISLCLLTKDERAGCEHDVPLIGRSWFDEIYAVDGHSKDGTIEYLQSQRIPVYSQPRGTLNAAVIYALEKCTTDALVLYHPKGSIDPNYLLHFRTYFDQGYELVVASRVIKGARNEEDSEILKPRKWFVLMLGLAARALFHREGNIIWDVLHGLRGMTCQQFRQLRLAETGATIDLEMVVQSYQKRTRRIEFPVVESGRLVGESHFKPLPTGWQLLKYLVRARLQS